MDLGLIVGFVLTWAFILGSAMLGGSLMGYYDLPSVVLVVGGSATIVFITHPPALVITAFKAVKKLLFPEKLEIQPLIEQMTAFAERSRRDGVLALEAATADIKDPFLKKAVQMIVDGMDPAVIEQVLTADIDNASERHDTCKSVFDSLGKYAPAMGMIGTLIGLVVMLANMSDPSAIGPGMAVALLTTMYGALISNGVTGPIADRMARRSAEEAAYKSIIIRGVLAIQGGDNPHMVGMKLRTYLPGKMQNDPKQLKMAA